MVTLLGICSALFVIINISSAQEACKTPNNWDGKCISLPQCRPLYRLLMRANIPAEQQNFLKRSQCGYDGTNVLVCCPNTFTIDDLLSGTKCGIQVGDKIFGGERALLTEFPWLALLHYRRPNTRPGFGCGGSLINDRYVLTAAHCIRGPSIIQKGHVVDFVRLGEDDQRSNPDCQGEQEMRECADPIQDISAAEVMVHESYDPWSRSQEHDIALIRLARPATITNYTRPVCLPIRDLQNRNYDGSVLTVAGFGKTENVSRSDLKMKLQLNGANLEQCTNTYRNSAINLSNNVLCAGGDEGKDSCTGDSGGPLVADETNDEDTFSYLVGVVSLGPSSCGTPGYPGVYTRVDKYIDWILDHMRK